MTTIFRDTKRTARQTAKPHTGLVPLCARFVVTLLLMVVGVSGMWGQTDYSGVYYIGSHGYVAANTTTNYYLCPTEEWYYYISTSPFHLKHSDNPNNDNGQPFMTTYQCRNGVYDATKAVWIVEKQSNGYYHIKRALDGKYLTYNVAMASGNIGRMRLHLESTADGDNALFQIAYVSKVNAFEITTKNSGPDTTNRKYLNVTGNQGKGNQPSLQATNIKKDGPGNINVGGIIGLWTSGADGDNACRWYLEKATIDPPAITDNHDGTVSITAEDGATIYYTIDGTTPTTSTTTSGTTSVTVTLTESTEVVKAIAKSSSDYFPTIVTAYNLPLCVTPVISVSNGTVTITCATAGATIHYTTDETEATLLSTLYDGPFPIGDASIIRAVASKAGYAKSEEANYVGFKTVHQSSEISDMRGCYLLASDFTSTTVIGTSEAPFKGIIDGQMNTLYESGALGQPLVAYAEGAVIKNVILKNVSISQNGSVGAIVGKASGYTRIYNCGILPKDATNSNPSTVASTDGYCGGLVGHLTDDSRVINCFSYANITGVTDVAGIVGHVDAVSETNGSNAAVTDGKYTNLRTAVVNCMFYGDITGGTNTNIYPVYGGAKMLNTGNDGINNYDFYRAEATFTPKDYNCSWPALEENLTRFEYYRSLLNGNRELCGWWVKSDVAPCTLTTTQVQAIEKDASLMAKWVLDPSIAPYPILKPFGKYPSVINPDPARRINPETKAWVSRTASSNTIQTNAAPDTHGETLGSISVTIHAGSHHSGSNSRTITITAMDIDNNDFCYGKIQLPYYNEVFGNPEGTTWSEKYGDNYTDMVVTGWDITTTSQGTTGTFSDDPITGYNFADRNNTVKDTHRVFAQGGYYYVPYGVTSITITAHWATAYYLSNTDGNYERVYFSNNKNNIESAGQPFAPAGTRSYESEAFGGKTINNGTIKSVLTSATAASTVYDCAIVLVGNYQYRNNTTAITGGSKPFTLMTVDLDFDNEPDYCLEWQIGGGDQGTTRTMIDPVRFDFLPIVELGTAMKEDGSKYLYAIGKLTPYGHFEVTETAFIHMGQFEYENKSRTIEGPVILNNGLYDQICRGSENDGDQNINYFILGGHVKMPSFTPGSHVKTPVKSRFCAVNVLGGEIKNFYLSGNYNATPTNEGNPHCYIDGGKLDFVASGAKEQIDGDVFWSIDHAAIGEFYGGGINSDKPVTGSINITIDRSHVTKFCGGPQYGDMKSGKTVTTHATGTTFGVFYGAGNGGTCYSQYDQSDFTPSDPNKYDWEASGTGKLTNYTALKYRNKATGYHAKYELEMINSSSGTMNNAVCRTYMYAAQFATTNTGDVSNTLTDCTIETNFYGGGLLGGVSGDVTSLLNGNTVVKGNVFGAGYGVADLSVDILPKQGYTPPKRNENTAVITAPVYPNATTYYWTHEGTFGSTTLNTTSPAILNPNGDGKNYLYTEIPLDNLGTVTGTVTLNIEGTTTVTGDVYGGGALSSSNTDAPTKLTTVNLKGGTVSGNVYGGAMGDAETAAYVGSTLVNLNGTQTVTKDAEGSDVISYNDNCVVKGSIFGCNNVNGTPLGNATVHVYKTQGYIDHQRTGSDKLDNIDDNQHSYEVAAVYGGGNLAAYEPTLSGAKTNVIIDGCDLTSIRQVYGGGNAASTPATQVDVNGTYEIEEVFGGGNGKDDISLDGGTTWIENPGANVGYKNYSTYNAETRSWVDNDDADTPEKRQANYQYGTGQANVNIYGGRVHRVYGGSNTKGNVRQVALTMLDEKSDCPFKVDEAYGGGKSAPMDGAAQLHLSCIPGLKAAYGGAEAANIQNDVVLNITNGNFDRVFGGNNISGTIAGTITVNVEETGCRPVIIGQLYGGGNQAAYTAPFVSGSDTERQPGPTLNVRSFTSIGEIYGGGYGKTAVVTGDTHVNINVHMGDRATADEASLEEDTQRTISFSEFLRTDDGGFEYDGEGNRKSVPRTVTVAQPSHKKGAIGAIGSVYGGGNAADVHGDTYVLIGTKDTEEFATNSTNPDHATVLGADIRGNVYGGGNQATVTGSTNVYVGKEKVE